VRFPVLVTAVTAADIPVLVGFSVVVVFVVIVDAVVSIVSGIVSPFLFPFVVQI
jgi:hypothetical protein